MMSILGQVRRYYELLLGREWRPVTPAQQKQLAFEIVQITPSLLRPRKRFDNGTPVQQADLEHANLPYLRLDNYRISYISLATRFRNAFESINLEHRVRHLIEQGSVNLTEENHRPEQHPTSRRSNPPPHKTHAVQSVKMKEREFLDLRSLQETVPISAGPFGHGRTRADPDSWLRCFECARMLRSQQ